MKTVLLVTALLVVPVLVVAQEYMINNFDAAPADTNYWAYFPNHGGQHYQTSEHADSAKCWLKVSYVPTPVQEGAGAMRLEYSVHDIESWGGYVKLEHWNPDSNGLYDWSAYDSVMFWYYNETPQSLPGRVHLRFNLHDVSDSPNGVKTYNVMESEYYYSFHYVLDNAPGWHRIAMPLLDGRFDPELDEWGGEAFNRTGWAGIQGNDILDLDKIKGFSLEFSISGSGAGDVGTGTVILDHLALFSPTKVEIIFFNGRELPSNVTLWGGWSGTGSAEVTDVEASTPGTRSILWRTPTADWAIGDGMGLFLASPKNLQASWRTDSLQFKIKAPAGLGQLEVVLFDPDEDGWGVEPDIEYNAIYLLEEAAVGYDGTWKQVKIALKDFNRFAGGWNPSINQWQGGEMDCTKVAGLKFNIKQASGLGREVYLDDIWTGNPAIDITPPAAPSNVRGVAGTYYNLVVWQDVPGEKDETYTVYASLQPIDPSNLAALDVVATKVQENTQAVTHWLYHPLVDKELTYYYAVECKDAAGNVSTLGLSGPATNTAQGIATISLNAPANFVADGDLGEWDASGIMPFVLTPETHHVPVGDVNNAADLTGTVYLAVDDTFLYVAADVVDDSYFYGPGNWWDQDAFQVFIGLYDQRGAKHSAIKRGVEPDYIIYFVQERLQLDYADAGTLYTPEHENYYFSSLGAQDYVIEARIPLDALPVQDDVRFHPVRGMRIPIDLYFHDNDGGTWQGNLGLSPVSTDHQWQNPQEWTYTWIGDTMFVRTDVPTAPKAQTVLAYALHQNYPNPFNPTTAISFTLQKPGLVKLELYNPLGQKVKTVLEEQMAEGTHVVQVSAEGLPSGVYIYRLQAGDFVQAKKMVLMR